MIDQAMKQADEKMAKAVEVTREEFAAVRTGRASPALVQRITVDYYGSPTPLQQLASVSVPESKSLLIHPYDRNAVSSIEKAIMASDLGITPSNDGANIRLNFPALTEERRKELIKVVRDRAEHGRVAIRNIRRHTKDEIDKDAKEGKVSEDDARRAEKDLQKLTDKHVGEIDSMLQRKEQELMEV
ncbi:MAG TPA: ribosome recycling factor [Actinomycetota bacterium]|nr:ribosome recycling factor [Actinomycetota bacterium]